MTCNKIRIIRMATSSYRE